MDQKFHHHHHPYKRGNIEEVARRIKVEPKNEEMVFIRGYDTKLPEPALEKALTKHFSPCGKIAGVTFSPKHATDQVVCMGILGEGVKEKVEQLNGSDLGGFKLAVKLLVLPKSRVRTPIRAGYVLPESVRKELELKRIESEARSEKRFKRRLEKGMTKLSLNKNENQSKNKMNHSSKKKMKKMKNKKENETL